MPSPRLLAAALALLAASLVPAGSPSAGSGTAAAPTTDAAAGACADEGGTSAVKKPRFVRQIATGETGWFASPGLVDLDGDGRLEIVAPFYSTFVFDAKGRQLGRGTGDRRVGSTRPAWSRTSRVTARRTSWSAGNEGTVAAYEFRAAGCPASDGWSASTTQRRPVAGGPRARRGRPGRRRPRRGGGDHDQHLADRRAGLRLRREGELFQPAGGHAPAWPRYNQLAGPGNDLRFNGVGNHGYGAYGENVGIGNIDDDPELEIITTFDNHQINAFNLDGTSILASPWFTNRRVRARRPRMGWGQFIRWADPRVEKRHYHQHAGAWPSPERQTWLQWTASPPSVADLDGDGRNEVIGIPNVETPHPVPHPGLRVHGARRRVRRRAPVRATSPRLRDAADVEPAGAPARRRLVPAHRHPRADRRRPRRRQPSRDRRRPAGWRRVRRRAGRRPALADDVRTAARQDVRLGSGRRRPEPGRHPRAGLRHVRTAPRRRSPGRALALAARSCRSRGCATRVRTATASAWPPRPRSATSPGTARSRSC